VDLVLSWISSPQSWDKVAFIQVQREDVRRQLGLDEKRSRFSPEELYHHSYLAQYADELSRPAAPDQKLTPREQEARRVVERIMLYRGVVSGEAWPVVPAAADAKPGEQWQSLAGDGKSQPTDTIRSKYAEMILAYRAGNEAKFESEALAARSAVESQVPGWGDSIAHRIGIEAFYNQTRPFLVAWIFYLLASLGLFASMVLAGRTAKRTQAVAFAFTALGAFCHIGGIALRCYVAGRPPVSNMYESIVWVSLGVLFFATILFTLQRQAVILAVATALGTLGLIAADAAPTVMDPGIHPLVPVLRSNYWLTIHVLTITLGYAAFALSLGLANVTLYHYLRGEHRPGAQARILNSNQLTYRAMQFGVVLLAAGTILGGVWADYSWGRFWGWDPKEVWALIALLGYIAILHARYAAWVGQFSFAAWTVIGFLGVAMAWYGVNFVLGAGLHSYGFANGGTIPVLSFIAVQLAYVGAVTLIRMRRRGHGKSRAAMATA
jgi:cytochrome c-type biogenesis protein CcsB